MPERRRTYLFERAYADFAARLRRFQRFCAGVCRVVWGWFWGGAGAVGFEYLIRACVVGSAIWACYAYFQYETGRGRGFSTGTAVAILFLFVYVFVLLWGWKMPVHFVARLVSAAAAVGALGALGVLAALVAAGFFTPYVAALLVGSVASFVVFLPMRLAHWVSLQKRKIGYRCPYDDCRYRNLPVHVCACGQSYANLQPSFYGILHHTCGNCGAKLPTMDFLGRNKLARLCGGANCGRPLLHSSLGELREWPIFVVGGPAAGKSVYLVQAIRRLLTHFKAVDGTDAKLDSEQQRREHSRLVGLLDEGQTLEKTAGAVSQAWGVALRVPKKIRCLLYLFDKPGEYFESMSKFGQMHAIEGLKGILLLVDPFSLPGLEAHARGLGSGLRASDIPLSTVVHNLINAVNSMVLTSPDESCKVPLAVVVGKTDALHTVAASGHTGLATLCQPGSTYDPAFSKACRDALERLGEGQTLRNLERKFTTIAFFSCSALGRTPDLRDARPFEPKGVEQPLLWLLDGAHERSREGAVKAEAAVR